VTRGVGVSRSGISDNPTLTMRVSYDGFGRRTAIYDPDKGRTSFTYNPSGQLECETPPDGTTTCKTYDSLGRLQNVRRASTGGIVIASYIYDEAESAFGAGRLTSVQDESGTKRFHYDSMTGLVNRVERTYISGGKIKKFDVAQTYAPSGLLLSRSYPATNIQIIYDYYPEGVLKDIKLHDPDGHIVNSGNGSILAEYQPPNEMGKVPSVTYGNGVRINYEYSNATGSLTRMHASNAQGDIADYAYSTNNEGLLTGVQDNEQASGVDLSETYQYDIARRLISANGPYGPDKQHPHITLNYAYGEDGQPRMMNNQLVAYGSGNPHRITDTANLTYTYDVSSGLGSGDVALRRDVNGSTQNFTYTYHNRLKSVHTYTQDGVSDTTFLYDIEGNRFEKKFDANGIDIITHYPAPDYQIRVDGGEEVHTILISKIDGALATFTFNAIYEIAMVPSTPDYYRDRMLAGFQRFPEVFGQNGIHRLTGIFTMIGGSLIDSIRYDQRIGTKIIRAGSSVFVLLVLLLLLLLWKRNPEKRSFAYLPNIFQRLTALTTLIVFYGTIGCVGVEIPPGMVPVDGTLNPDVSGLIGNFYFITNQVHSNHLVTDANGKLICRYVYRPFGGLNMNLTDMDVDGDGVQFLGLQKFTGQEYDYETGLYNYKARIYDQETGMFLQPDPRHTENIGFDNYDRYAYVNNNPINFTDPSGESWLSVAAKHIGGAGFWGKLVPRGTHISFHLPSKLDIKPGRFKGGMRTAIEMAVSYYYGGGSLAVGGALAAGAATNLLTMGVFAISQIIQANAFGDIGYVAGGLYGGLRKSRLNYLHWDSKSAGYYANEGYAIGSIVQATVAAIVTLYETGILGGIGDILTGPVDAAADTGGAVGDPGGGFSVDAPASDSPGMSESPGGGQSGNLGTIGNETPGMLPSASVGSLQSWASGKTDLGSLRRSDVAQIPGFVSDVYNHQWKSAGLDMLQYGLGLSDNPFIAGSAYAMGIYQTILDTQSYKTYWKLPFDFIGLVPP